MTSSKTEAREILAELKKILQDTLKILDFESTKQEPVFEKNGEKQCQAPSTK